MATTVLDIDLLPILKPMIEILDRAEPVEQQQVLELLITRFIFRATDDLETMNLIADSFSKHVKQLVRQGNEMGRPG
jgi:hypothetical protein